MFVEDKGFCKSVQEHEAYWMDVHTGLLEEDLQDIKGFDSFVNGFNKLPEDCQKLLIQLRPMLYRYHREKRTKGRERFLPQMIQAMRLLREEYCRRKDGQYVLKKNAPNIVKFFGRVVGNDRIVDFRVTYEAKQAAAEKKANQ